MKIEGDRGKERVKELCSKHLVIIVSARPLLAKSSMSCHQMADVMPVLL